MRLPARPATDVDRLSDPTRPDIPFHAIVDDGGRLIFEVFGRSETAASLTTGPNAGAGCLRRATPTRRRSTRPITPSTASVSQFGHESTRSKRRHRW
jgi:hypothetical protein